MEDQITELRKLLSRPIVIGITGKEGVGKTNITINIGVELAKEGKKVLIIDKNLIYPIVPYNAKQVTSIKMDIQQLKEIEENFDYIFIDIEGGTANWADEVIIMTVPEILVIVETYALIKIITKNNAIKTIKLLTNRVKNEEEAIETVERIRTVANKFLNVEIENFGFVYEDKAVPQAVAMQTPFVISNPNGKASICIKTITEKIKSFKKKIGKSLIETTIPLIYK